MSELSTSGMAPGDGPMSPDAEEAAYEARRAAFAAAHGVCPVMWSPHNLSRMLRRTGERPGRVRAMRASLGVLGMMSGYSGVPEMGIDGVFVHGEMWGRDGHPVMLVGHPYEISEVERGLLAMLARTFPVLRVAIDDEPSYYGHGAHHVRVEVAEPRAPYRVPPATSYTRSYASTARHALRKEFVQPPKLGWARLDDEMGPGPGRPLPDWMRDFLDATPGMRAAIVAWHEDPLALLIRTPEGTTSLWTRPGTDPVTIPRPPEAWINGPVLGFTPGMEGRP